MRRVATVAVVLALLGFAVPVKAADDPTGTWKWTVEIMGQSRDMTMKLKLDGEKLTGAMVGRNNQETAIENAKFKDGNVTFSVTRERMGQKFTTKYDLKLSGDTLKGKSTFERDGQTQSRDFEAKRAK